MSKSFDKLKSSLSALIFEEDSEQQQKPKPKQQPQPQQPQPQQPRPQQPQRTNGSDEFRTRVTSTNPMNTAREDMYKDPEPEEVPQNDSEEQEAPVAEIKPIGTSIITESTVITGNMRSESHINVEGVIQGNVETKANVTIVGGKVTGNIKGNMVGTKSATITGDIASNKSVEILEDSYIQGNIIGEKIVIAGHVIGNISCNGILSLKPTAIVEGDIFTYKLIVDEDAIINGRISMNR